MTIDELRREFSGLDDRNFCLGILSYFPELLNSPPTSHLESRLLELREGFLEEDRRERARLEAEKSQRYSHAKETVIRGYFAAVSLHQWAFRKGMKSIGTYTLFCALREGVNMPDLEPPSSDT